MKINILFSYLLFLTCVANAQFIPSNQKTFGGTSNDELTRFFNPNDLSYSYMIGRSLSGVSGNKTEGSYGGYDLWIVKLDGSGNILWDKTIGGTGNDYFSNAIITDNSIFIGGTSESGISGNKTVSSNGMFDFWTVKLDHQGTIQAQNSYGGTQNENLNTIQFLNNELVLVGSSLSGITGNKTSTNYGNNDVWILKVDTSNLSISTQKNIGSPFEEGGFDIELVGSNYFVACISETGIGNDKTDAGYGLNDIWLLKLDLNWNVVSDKCYGGTDNDGFSLDMCQLNGELYFTTMSFSNAGGNKTQNNFGSVDASPKFDCWLFKVNPSTLNLAWDVAYGGTRDELYPRILPFSANQVIVSVWTQSAQNTGNITEQNFGMNDTKFVIVDFQGTLENQFTFGANLQDYASVSGVYNNTVYFSGYSSSGISGNKTVGTNGQLDGWIGEVPVTSLALNEHVYLPFSLSLYPNPTTQYIHVNYKTFTPNSDSEIKILNSIGQVMKVLAFNSTDDAYDVSELSPGSYWLEIDGNIARFVKE